MNRRYDNEVRITPSVLDRLLDFEPQLSREAMATRATNLRELKEAVKRDLEWLLNTRQIVDGIPPGLKELSRSVAAYGLPDFSGVSVKSPAEQKRMMRTLETAIRNFEPRLEDVNVTLIPASDIEQRLRFRIDARLRVEPTPEPVTFDTVLRAGIERYEVKSN